MERTLLLDIVVTEGATVFELLSGKDQALLIRGNPFFVLDLGFHIVDGIRWFHIESNGLSREGLYEDLRWEAEATIERQWIKRRQDVESNRNSATTTRFPLILDAHQEKRSLWTSFLLMCI